MGGLGGLQLGGGGLVLGVEALLALLHPGDLGLQRRELDLGALAALLRVGEGAGEPLQLGLGGLDAAGAGRDLPAQAGQALPAVRGRAQGRGDPLVLLPRGPVGLGARGEDLVERGAVGGDLPGELGLLGAHAVGGGLQLLGVAAAGLLLGLVGEQPQPLGRERLHPAQALGQGLQAVVGLDGAGEVRRGGGRGGLGGREAAARPRRGRPRPGPGGVFSAASSASSRCSELLAWTTSSASSRSRESRRSACTTCARRAASAWRPSGLSWRRISLTRSATRVRLASIASSLRSAFSLRRRCFRTPAASSMKARRSSGEACRTASIWPWPTMTCISRPMPESESSSWTSSRRQVWPLIAYSEPPVRNIVRVIVTSANSMGSAPSVLSMVRLTSARPRAERPSGPVVPAKMTSSILPPRRLFALCSPMTQVRASTTLDFPDPLGPTTHVIPGSSRSVVAEANDLNPLRVRVFRCTGRKPNDGAAMICAGEPGGAAAGRHGHHDSE